MADKDKRAHAGIIARYGAVAAFAALVVAATTIARLMSPALAVERALPPPAATASERGTQTIVLAGGCFWGVQGVFQHVDGVISAVSGYAGGGSGDADYRRVSSGATGHAEAVKVTYDPSRVTYSELLRIFFSVAHDPTQRNRQGPDVGRQYRSAIFPANAEQARIARAYIAQLDGANFFSRPIATTIESGSFYAAEAYHQDYMTRHPNELYIRINDAPKLEALKRFFPNDYRASPVLVGAAG